MNDEDKLVMKCHHPGSACRPETLCEARVEHLELQLKEFQFQQIAAMCFGHGFGKAAEFKPIPVPWKRVQITFEEFAKIVNGSVYHKLLDEPPTCVMYGPNVFLVIDALALQRGIGGLTGVHGILSGYAEDAKIVFNKLVRFESRNVDGTAAERTLLSYFNYGFQRIWDTRRRRRQARAKKKKKGRR